jgi:hypothetical protein
VPSYGGINGPGVNYRGGYGGKATIVFDAAGSAALRGVTLYYIVGAMGESPLQDNKVYGGGGGGYSAVWIYDPNQDNLSSALWLISAGGGGGGSPKTNGTVGRFGGNGCLGSAIYTRSIADQTSGSNATRVGAGGITNDGGATNGSPGSGPVGNTGNGGTGGSTGLVKAAGAGGGGGFGSVAGAGGAGYIGANITGLTGMGGGIPGGGGGGGAGEGTGVGINYGLTPTGGGGGGYIGGKAGDNVPGGNIRRSNGGECQFFVGPPFSSAELSHSGTSHNLASVQIIITF